MTVPPPVHTDTMTESPEEEPSVLISARTLRMLLAEIQRGSGHPTLDRRDLFPDLGLEDAIEEALSALAEYPIIPFIPKRQA